MQFIENTAFGLRSARFQFSRADTGVSVTIFPMIHIGEKEFYDSVGKSVSKHDVLIFEGVTGRVSSSLTASYRWLDFKRLGLVKQPSFKSLEGPRKVHGDVRGVEFDGGFSALPLKWCLLLFFGAPLFGLYGKFFATRGSLAKHLAMEDLRDAREQEADDASLDPVGHLIGTSRDKRLCEVIAEQTQELSEAGGGTIAVVYGAAHMRAVVRQLRALGFVQTDSDWQLVFRAS